MTPDEQLLLDQLNNPSVPKSTAFTNVHEYLSQQTCWWCKHKELANCLLEVFQYQHNATVQSIWNRMSQQLEQCTDCINNYHTAQAALLDAFDTTRPLLQALWHLDKQRLLAWVAVQQQQAPGDQPAGDPAAGVLSTQQLYALFELLGYSHYLDDAELCAAAVGLLQHVGWALETSEGTPYAGLFRLLAHPDGGVRSKALSVVKPMGPLDDMDIAGHTLSEVLDCWLTQLLQQQQQGFAQLCYAAQHQQLVQPGLQQQWPRPCVWSALKAVMGMLQGECMTSAVELYPTVLPSVLAQATPGAYATAAGAPVLGEQGQPLAAAPYGLVLAPEGSLEQKHALGCLNSLLVGLKHELWQLNTATLSPQQLVQHLEGSVWSAVRLNDTSLLKALLQVLQSLAQALLPCLVDSEVVELWQESDDEQGLPAAAPSAGELVGAESKPAVLGCLRLLLVQLPGSAAVPLLMRGLALEAGLAVCFSALQCPRCPGTAVFAHLWGPVAAALLVVPQDQYSNLQGAALQQHQAPGIMQMLPVLRQMSDLQERITEAAAGLVATALQADAAVLHATLSKQQSGAAANKHWLLPGALDVVELSLTNRLAYKCAPSIWLAFAGCGHAVVSASFIAAAAQLVPLSAAAAAAASRLQTVFASAQQQLDASLQLPDPEKVDLLSSSHALYAVDCAGWLHQQFTRAAVRHMHICSCRSRLFLLPPGLRTPLKSEGQGGQQQIDAMFRQHSASTSPPPDSTAAAAYALAVRGCCTLMVQGRSGPAAVLAAEAEYALLSSCGVPLGQVKQAVQQHLLAPGSVCAEGVVQALQLELQHLLEHGKIAKAFLRAHEQLSSFFSLSGFALGAAISHGLDVMLPIFASYLAGLWQLTVDALTAGCKLLTSDTACAACGALDQPRKQQPVQQQAGNHTGPGIGSVLRALLDALPAMWQSYQMLITQRCEQRQLYLDAADEDDTELMMLTPMSQHGTPRQGSSGGAATAVAAELHRQSGWLVHLLGLGRQLHAAPGPTGCSCISEAAADRHLRLSWRVCLEDVVKATRSSLPKAVKAAATQLMQSNEPSVDKIWLAQLFPAAAPGNLASSGLGRWPSRQPTATLSAPLPAAPQVPVKPDPAAVAAATASLAGPSAGPSVTAAASAGVTRQTSIDLADYDVIELLGEWSEGSDHAADEAAGSDSDVIIVDSDEPEEQQQHAPLMPQSQQVAGSQAWPWLRKQTQSQQPQQQARQLEADVKPDLLQQQQEVKKAVSQFLQSSKSLHPTPQQQRRQQAEQHQQQHGSAAAAGVQQPPQQQFSGSLPRSADGDMGRAAPTAAAAAAGKPAEDASAHLLRFRPPSKAPAAAAAAAAAGGERNDAAGPVAGTRKRVKRPDSNSAPAAQGQQPQQQQQHVAEGPRSRPASDEPDEYGLWPEEWKDIKGVHAPETYPVYRYNRPALRPRKPTAPEGLSKGDQVRRELLGRGPAADSDAEEAALAAELIAAAGVSHGRRQAPAGPWQQQAYQQRQGRDSSRVTSGRQDGVSAAGKAALHRAAAALVQQQRQAQEPELLLQRMQQRRREEQQQALLRQQQQQAREERRKQLEATRAAETAAAAAARQNKQQAPAAAAASRAGISLVSDDALFKQAAAASAAHRPKPQAVRTISTVRHSGPLFLKSSRHPAMGFGGLRAPPAREYPVLRLEDVWSELLSWGYQGAVGSSGQGSSAAAAAAAAATCKLLEEGRVPLRFSSVGHYCAVFRGLLLEELRAGLAAAHEEHVAGSTSSSGPNTRGTGFRCMPIMIDSVQRQSKVSVVVAQVDTSALPPRESNSPRSEDFVLLTRVQLNSGSELSEDRLPRSHLSGLVVEASMLQHGLRQITLHVAPASGGSEVMAQFWRQLLAPGTQLWVTVITSLVPNFRELQALIAMQHAPAGDRLLRHVLHPEPPRTAAAAGGANPDSSTQQLAQLPAGLQEALKSSYNSSQCAAVSACLDKRYPFVLVQGPPGTGKTSAIIGMLSALLGAADSQRGGGRAAGRGRGGAAKQGRTLLSAEASAGDSNSSLPAHAAQSALKLGVIPPVRVLVCAQSNAAIDELIIRLANTGVWCGSGSRRAPAMVRMGRSDAMHASILMFHVDALADAAVQQQAQDRAREAAEAVTLGQQQLQQQQGPGKTVGKAAGPGSHAAAAGQSGLESKVHELRERLREVEQKLAALAQQQGAGDAVASLTAADGTAAAAAAAQQQQGVLGQKRSEGTSGFEAAAAAGAMPPPPNKLPRAVGDADVAAKRAAVDQPQSSGSDMDLSDGEGQAGAGRAAADLDRGTAGSRSRSQHNPDAADKPHRGDPAKSSRHRGSGEPRSGSRHGGSGGGRSSSSRSPHRHSTERSRRHRSSRSRSPSRHRSSSHQEHRSSSGRGSRSPGSRKRSRSRGHGSKRSRSRGHGSKLPVRRRNDRDRGSRDGRSRAREGDRGRESSRDRGDSRRRSSRSRSRGRGSDRDGSSRAADRELTSRDRGSSRDADERGNSEAHMGTRDRGNSSKGDPHGDPHFDSDRSCDADRSARHSKGDEQGRSSSRKSRAGADATGDAAADRVHARGDGNGVVAHTAGEELPRDRQQQQLDGVGLDEQQYPAASTALLLDQQRSLLAALRQVERELQQAEGVPSGADRRELDRARKGARQAVIQAAEVVMCTLSASGGDLLNAFPPGAAPLFDVVVVDEAAQALEPATLIPFQLIKPGSGRVVLVGDPCQLPPTVLSKAAEASMLAQSMFERLARGGWPVQLLQEQYRSHPAISAFPSRFFYQGKLLDGSGINAVSKGAPFHSKLAFGPMVVWDCQEGRERGGGSRGGGSLQNPAEAELAATLVAGLLSEHRSDVGSIAVISPYRAQVACLRAEFRRQLGGDTALAAANIEFGTVDGFQGREADVVVFSCVRAQPEAAAAAAAAAALSGSGSGGSGGGPRIGFLQDVRRMNVGLTRGRRAVWVVCHADTLTASPAWRPLLQEAHARGVLLAARYPFRRLLTAPDRQLRGSYWTPATATPAALAVGPAAPSAAAVAAGLAGAGQQVNARASSGAAVPGTERQGGAAAATVGVLPGVAQLVPNKTEQAAAAAGPTASVAKRVVRPAAGTAGQSAAAGGAPLVGAASAAALRTLGSGTATGAGRALPRQKPSNVPAAQAAGSGAKNTQPAGSASLQAAVQGSGRGPTGAAASASAKPQRHAGSVGLDAEAAAWAAAEAARKAGRGGTDGKPPGTAATDAVKQALEKRVQQQHTQRTKQQQAGRSGAAAAAAGEGRPIADAAKSVARRTVLRPGQQTPAAPRPQPPQHQQRHPQGPAANQPRGPTHPASASGRSGAQAQRGPSGRGGAGAAQQQHDPQLRAALLARLKKQGQK